MPMASEFDLTWIKIRNHIEDRIETLRVALEAHGLPNDRTEFRRGQIAELRHLIRAVETDDRNSREG